MDRIFLGICLPSIDMTELCLRRQFRKGWAACPSLRHQIEYQSRFDFPGRLLQASGHGDVVGGWSGGSGRTPMFVDGRGERIGAYAQNLEAVRKPGQCKGQIVKRHLDEHGTYAAGICRGGGDGNFDLFDLFVFLFFRFFRIGHFFPDFSFYSEDIYHYKMEKT